MFPNHARKSTRLNKGPSQKSEFIYIIPKSGQTASVHPMSILVTTEKEMPEWVIYTELIQTSR